MDLTQYPQCLWYGMAHESMVADLWAWFRVRYRFFCGVWFWLLGEEELGHNLLRWVRTVRVDNE